MNKTKNNNESKIKKETWQYLRNISLIVLITSIIIISVLFKSQIGTGVFLILLFWPLIICFIVLLLVSLITFIISLIKLKKWKK